MHAIADPKSETIENEYCTDDVCEAVVAAVAEEKGVDPLELDPIYEVIDPDALNALFKPSSTSVEVRFSMAGCRVVVRGADDVNVLSESGDDGRATVGQSGE